jgi:hypothetical protein
MKNPNRFAYSRDAPRIGCDAAIHAPSDIRLPPSKLVLFAPDRLGVVVFLPPWSDDRLANDVPRLMEAMIEVIFRVFNL